MHIRRELLFARLTDRDDYAIVVSCNRLATHVLGRQWEAFANRSLDGRTGGGYKVTKLVAGADNEGPEASRAELHEMDSNGIG